MKALIAILKNWVHAAILIAVIFITYGLFFSGYSIGTGKNGFFCNKTNTEFPKLKDGK